MTAKKAKFLSFFLFLSLARGFLLHAAPPDDARAQPEFRTHSFDSPGGKYTIRIRETDDGPHDCFVDLLRQSDGKVIQTLHWPQAHKIEVSWNPSGSLAVLALEKIYDSHLRFLQLFHVTSTGLHEIPVLPKLSFRSLLPKNNPLRYQEAYYQHTEVSKWLDDTHFLCSMQGVFREEAAEGYVTAGQNMATEGYVTLDYEATVQCGKTRARLVSFRQIPGQEK